MTEKPLSDATIAAIVAFASIAEDFPDLLPSDRRKLAREIDARLSPRLGTDSQGVVEAVVRELRAALATPAPAQPEITWATCKPWDTLTTAEKAESLIEELEATAERITRHSNSPLDGLLHAAADVLRELTAAPAQPEGAQEDEPVTSAESDAYMAGFADGAAGRAAAPVEGAASRDEIRRQALEEASERCRSFARAWRDTTLGHPEHANFAKAAHQCADAIDALMAALKEKPHG